ncbi:MAG: sensor histidine kinase, partial [Acidimicrobiia bacterium]
SLLTSIYPVEVPPEGVGAGLEDLVDVLRSQGASVTVDISRRAELRPAVALIVLRVGRELLRNVIAHAQASEVTIKLRSERGIVVFELVDDGVGFSAEEWERRRAEGHLGLALLVDLVTDAGGRLDISSEPGEGMRARLELVGET